MLDARLFCRECAISRASIRQPGGKTNGLSITSLVLGIVSLPLSFCYGAGALFGMAALVTGFIARRQIKESGGVQEGNGMALAGMITGGIPTLLICCSVVVIAALTIMGPLVGNVFSTINASLIAP
jgi:hypothetical protein